MTSEAQEISEAVASWLHYKSLTGLRGLFTESSMAVPIAEYLSSRYGSEVETEKAHPLFDNGKKGRPKQIDFVRVRRGDRTWDAVYECKFQRPDFKNIVGDLCRLACLAQADGIGRPTRYFVFAGKPGPKGMPLEKSFNTGDGSRSSYFDGILRRDESFVSIEFAFSIRDLHPKQFEVFKGFAENNQVSLPSRIVTKLSGWSKTSKYVCAVWQIKSAQGSKLRSAGELIF